MQQPACAIAVKELYVVGAKPVRGQEPPRWGGHMSDEGREGLLTGFRPLCSGSITSCPRPIKKPLLIELFASVHFSN